MHSLTKLLHFYRVHDYLLNPRRLPPMRKRKTAENEHGSAFTTDINLMHSVPGETRTL